MCLFVLLLVLRLVSLCAASGAQVRVAMKAVGICGSDVHYLKHGRIGDFVVNAPMVIGHESAGVVTEVSSAWSPHFCFTAAKQQCGSTELRMCQAHGHEQCP